MEEHTGETRGKRMGSFTSCHRAGDLEMGDRLGHILKPLKVHLRGVAIALARPAVGHVTQPPLPDTC